MVRLQLGDTPGEVFVGDQVPPNYHPAAELFPTADKAGIAALKKDILRNGLQQPIVMTPNEELLEGRGRWQACRELGLTPRRRIERGDPWLYIFKSNQEALEAMLPQARMMLTGHVPAWPAGSSRPRNAHRYEDPPTLQAISDVTGVHPQAVSRAQRIVARGVKSLQKLVADEKVALYTAVRVIDREPGDQEVYVNRVLNGANPLELARDDRTEEDRRADSKREYSDEFKVIRGRHRLVREQTLRALIDALHGVRLVLDAADGLDPAISPEEAAQFARELAAQHAAYRRVVALLKARKEEK